MLCVSGEHGPDDLCDGSSGRGGAPHHHRRGEQPQHGLHPREAQRQSDLPGGRRAPAKHHLEEGGRQVHLQGRGQGPRRAAGQGDLPGGVPRPAGTSGHLGRIWGQVYQFQDISREQMGAYLCIASNKIPPSVSKRITLIVECKLWIISDSGEES